NSTGIIGQRLDMDNIEGVIREAVKDMRSDETGILSASKAIMTTDSFSKIASRTVKAAGKEVKVTGFAKGAGMIAPDLVHATMIAVIITNAYIPKDRIDGMLKEAVDRSFNLVVVDGDTSTNDMVVLLANGKAGNVGIDKSLQEALNQVCMDLARMIVKDGEGATKLFEVEIEGAKSEEDAKKAAKAVAGSILVKTAVFGENPNWGRIIAAIGYSGAEFNKERLSLLVKNDRDKAILVKEGKGIALNETEELKKAGEILKGEEFTFTADLGVGGFSAVALGCDIGYNYVKINAEYTT
ncbi:MAG: bifunctional ornithine acetyltransferase/N-acetylglutamate synthase, partial [Candidatus Hydrothermarchaeales archaeon]